MPNLAIAKDDKNKFFVVDTVRNVIVTPKYSDEEHCLRQIKLRTRYKKDHKTMPAIRLWEKKEELVIEKEPTTVEVIPAVNQDVPVTLEEIKSVDVDPEPEPEINTLNNINRDLKNKEYACSKCQKIHRDDSKIGKRHLKYKI